MATAASGPCAGGPSSDCEGEEQEDPSSSHNDVLEARDVLNNMCLEDKSPVSNTIENEDELSVFRQQWQRELDATPSPQKGVPNKDEALEPLTEEDMAKQLFLRAVEYERSGKLYEAIQHYKRAMQIMPDVETRLYESSDLRPDTPEEAETEVIAPVEHVNATEDDEEMVEGEELATRLQRILSKKGCLCEPELPVKGAHLSWLPYEVCQTILRWVAGAELHAAALERVAAVCRALHLAARDPELWRALCLKTWGIDCGTARAHGFGSWRQMYILRPRLLLHGCYISKTTYLRHGENSFQDHCYRPWYLIEYYRYLRFFPGGTVLMWTTPDEPAGCVGHLKYRHPKPGMGIMAGHYRLMGTKVVIVVKKPTEKKPAAPTRFRSRRRDAPEPHFDTTFHLELELLSVRGRLNWQLQWRLYSVSTGRDQWTHFDITPNTFPPFAYSRVRNYTAETHAPL